MNADDILDMIGDAKGIYVWDAQKVRDGSALAIKRKMPARKILLIAAAIMLLAATITACAYAIRRIRMDLIQHNIPAQAEMLGTDAANPEETPPVNVLTDCYPQTIPEGYEILCGSPLNYNSRNIQYYNKNGKSITFWISTKPTDEEMVLRPPVEESGITLACGEGIYRKNEGTQVLRWENTEEGYYANLFTDDITVDLVSMADSMAYGASIPISVWYHRGQEWSPWYPQTLPVGYTCQDVTPISNGYQIITYENGKSGYIRYCVSSLEDFTPTQISDEAFWEESEVNGFAVKILCNQDDQRILYLENKEEGFYAFLETMDEAVDLIALAESIAPGEKLEVSKSYLGPDYAIELEQEPTTYIEWQSVYPQKIPEGYELNYVGDRAYGQQTIEWKNGNGELISYTLYYRLGQHGREFDGSGQPEVVSINGHTGYRTDNSLLWTDEELGFAYDLRATGNVDLIVLAESVAPGPELEFTNDTTAEALEQLGDYQITALPNSMIEDGLSGAPLEDEDDWYSYVRRWYYDRSNNDQVYFTYETYLTDCTSMEERLRMLISLSMTSDPEYITINGCPGIAMQDGDRATVAWMIGDLNKGVSFQLYSEQFTVTELLKMAESVRKK